MRCRIIISQNVSTLHNITLDLHLTLLKLYTLSLRNLENNVERCLQNDNINQHGNLDNNDPITTATDAKQHSNNHGFIWE